MMNNFYRTKNLKSIAAYIFIGALALLLVIFSLRFPIYPDEITNIFIVGNIDFSNSRKLWLIPSCLNSPLFINEIIVPIAAINSWFYALISNHQILRLTSLVLGLWMLFFWRFSIAQHGANLKNTIYSFLIIFWPIFFINTFLYIRPEKLILLFLILCLHTYYNKKYTYYYFIIISIIFCLCLYNHPKAYYFSPIYLYILFNFIDIKKPITTIFYILIAFYVLSFAIFYYPIHNITWPCPNIEYINNIVKNYAVNPLLIIKDPVEFFVSLYGANDFIRIERALWQILLRQNYDIGYLPSLINSNIIISIVNAPFLLLLILFYLNFVDRLIYIKNLFFPFIYILINIMILIFSANKSAYDISLFFVSNALIAPYILSNSIKNSKVIIIMVVTVSLFGYIKILTKINGGWVGPDTSVVKIIDNSKIATIFSTYINNYDYVLYDDSTFFAVRNQNKIIQPITYFKAYGDKLPDIVKNNLNGNAYLVVTRCVYLDELFSEVSGLSYKEFRRVNDVPGLPDSLCIGELR